MSHTPNQIMQMTPEELRLAIAKAMGIRFYELIDCENYVYPASESIDKYSSDLFRETQNVTPARMVWSIDDKPTISDWPNDYNAAMELWAEMAPSHRMILHQVAEKKFHCYAEAKDGQPRFPIERPHGGDIWADGETAAIAICRAWLAWKTGQA